MSGTIRNWGRSSEIDEVRLPEAELGVWIYEKVLSIRVLEVLLILVGWIICGRNICEESESKNSFVGACLSYFKRSTLKSPRRKTFIFFRNFIKQSIQIVIIEFI